MLIKVNCEFELNTDIINDIGGVEHDIKKYEDYITFLLSKAHAKALDDFFNDINRDSTSLLKSFLSDKLSKQADEIGEILNTLKINVTLEQN
jgi:hypothetical protein